MKTVVYTRVVRSLRRGLPLILKYAQNPMILSARLVVDPSVICKKGFNSVAWRRFSWRVAPRKDRVYRITLKTRW